MKLADQTNNQRQTFLLNHALGPGLATSVDFDQEHSVQGLHYFYYDKNFFNQILVSNKIEQKVKGLSSGRGKIGPVKYYFRNV